MGLQQVYLLRATGCVSPLFCYVSLWLLLLALSLSSSPCTHPGKTSRNGDLQQLQLQHSPQSSSAVASSFSAALQSFRFLPSHALSAGRAPGAAWGSSTPVRGNTGSGERSSPSRTISWFAEGWGLSPSSQTSAVQLRRSAEAAAAGQAPLLSTAALASGAADKALQQRSSSPASALAFVGGQPTVLLRTGESKVTDASFSSQQQQPAATAARPPTAAAAAQTRGTATASRLRSSSSNRSEYSLDGDSIEGPLQPLRGMVLLQRKDVQETSAGGVYLPSESKDRQVLAKVLAVGPGELRQGDSTAGFSFFSFLSTASRQRIPLDVQPGDWAVISRHAYDTVKYNGKECVLVAAADILAKVKDASKEADPVPTDLLPLGEAVLVKVYKQPEKTASGLYVHPGGDAQSRTLKRGVVVAVGPGRYDKEGKRGAVEIRPGKNVLYPQYAQDEPDMKYGTDFYAFVKAADILAEW